MSSDVVGARSSRCDSELSLLISQEHSARRCHARDQQEAEKCLKILSSREEERKAAQAALESHEQTIRREEKAAGYLLDQGEEELRVVWVLLQQIEKQLRFVGLRRFYVDKCLIEERAERERLRTQVLRSIYALNDLRGTLDAVEDDHVINTFLKRL